ncbi:hypothetical protein BB427_17200 [Pseudoalteromonas sp. BMB]|uniref:ABC transporter permease n=1 Tax=Pseudoalteromonas sp. BMB TaxID=1874619 RepID=UPI00083DF769|nr:ABC transporter permease [Pseudoalteromonas sp. BMB]ODB35454.1 hypothetical protein BB427_17200 [Pseudoalteromonas sp. BMB]
MNHSIYLLKQAWAGLYKKKGFALTVVTTLGLTLGALLTILTLAYVVIAKPLPYPEQDSLYRLNAYTVDEKKKQDANPDFNLGNLVNLYDNQKQFSQSAMLDYREGVLSSLSTQPSLNTTYTSPGLFDLLGAKMILGRKFEQTEEKDSFNPVAILSFDVWQNEFSGDAGILEQSVTIGGTNFRVVGVLDKSFIEPQLYQVGRKTDIFLPWDYNPINLNADYRERRGMFSGRFQFVGKLDSLLSNSQVEQTLTTLINDEWRENISDNQFFNGWSINTELQSFNNAILGNNQSTILMLLVGIIGLVLVACANITNLFMSRTAEQQRQLAIQAAVGAKKSHLFHALLAQSALLVSASIIVALIVAKGGFWVLQQYLALRLPRVDELTMSGVTLGSALLVAVILGVFFARLSANMINYRTLNATLQSSGKGTGVQVSQKVRTLLVISQVTIVTLLVFINISLLRNSLEVIEQPLGFETENLWTVSSRINATDSVSAEERRAMVEELKSKLLSLPQVTDIAQATSPLHSASNRIQVIEKSQERLIVRSREVDESYFQIIAQPLLEGDYYSAADVRDQRAVIIINDVYANKIAPDGSAIGEKIRIGDTLFTVSGVVKGVKMPAESEVAMEAYRISTRASARFVLKLETGQLLSRELLVSTQQAVDSRFDLVELTTLNEQRDTLLFTQYTTAVTSAVLAVLTFFLATIGLYGILSYATQMRKFELGTRLAIGAKRKDVIALIVSGNAGSVVKGVALSLGALLGLYITFSDALVDYVNPQVIVMYPATLVLVSMMTLFACYWPLRPIINAPPIRSLRDSQ